MDPNAFRRRLHYTAALACGVAASVVTYIICSALSINLHLVLAADESRNQFGAAMAWWAIAGAGFAAAWAAQVCLVTAARERDFIYGVTQRCLIVLVFAVTAAAGILSKSGSIGGTANVITGLTTFGLGFVCSYCGMRMGYLSTDQA